jgi:hypothetical protein
MTGLFKPAQIEIGRAPCEVECGRARPASVRVDAQDEVFAAGVARRCRPLGILRWRLAADLELAPGEAKGAIALHFSSIIRRREIFPILAADGNEWQLGARAAP